MADIPLNLNVELLHEELREAMLACPINPDGSLGIDPKYPTNEPGIFGYYQCTKYWSTPYPGQSGRCRHKAMSGREICEVHGGYNAVGALNRNYRDGRYSRFMPGALLERYEAAQSDTELLALRDEIALIDARTQELLARVDSGESESTFKQLQKSLKDFKDARQSGSSARMQLSWDSMEKLIEQGQSDYEAWKEIKANIALRQNLVESERARLVDMQQMITAEMALGLIGQIELLIKEHVHDGGAINRISAGLVRLTATRPSVKIR